MQSNVVTAVFLPIALGVIMLGLGLSLTIADFKRVVVYPRAVIIGLSRVPATGPSAAGFA